MDNAVTPNKLFNETDDESSIFYGLYYVNCADEEILKKLKDLLEASGDIDYAEKEGTRRLIR